MAAFILQERGQGRMTQMKIKEITNETPGGLDSIKLKANKDTRHLDFLHLFEKANADLNIFPKTGSSHFSPGEEVLPLNPPQTVPSLYSLSPPENRTIHSETLQATERTLELLEKYQRALIDPDISLKEMDPTIELLSKEMEGLNQMSSKLPSTDPLQKMIHEVGILSAVEIQKFKRGDYL